MLPPHIEAYDEESAPDRPGGRLVSANPLVGAVDGQDQDAIKHARASVGSVAIAEAVREIGGSAWLAAHSVVPASVILADRKIKHGNPPER